MNKILFEEELLFLTPCFCRGAYDDMPEIRASSIRGMLRWWFDALYHNTNETDVKSHIFGEAGGKNSARASNIVVRVEIIDHSIQKYPVLPHKNNGGGNKTAFGEKTRFKLIISNRNKELSPEYSCVLQNVIKAWVLLGALGNRGNRAAGSVWFNHPMSESDFQEQAKKLLENTELKFFTLALVDRENPEALRKIASDTIGGREDRKGDNELRELGYPLGSMKPRKPSSLKLKVGWFKQNNGEPYYKLIAVWDGRKEKDKIKNLNKVADLMEKAGKKLGGLIKTAKFYP